MVETCVSFLGGGGFTPILLPPRLWYDNAPREILNRLISHDINVQEVYTAIVCGDLPSTHTNTHTPLPPSEPIPTMTIETIN